MNAEDHKRTNIKGNILVIVFYRLKNYVKSIKSTPKMNLLLIELYQQITYNFYNEF